jgi:hypothetical protein
MMTELSPARILIIKIFSELPLFYMYMVLFIVSDDDSEKLDYSIEYSEQPHSQSAVHFLAL